MVYISYQYNFVWFPPQKYSADASTGWLVVFFFFIVSLLAPIPYRRWFESSFINSGNVWSKLVTYYCTAKIVADNNGIKWLRVEADAEERLVMPVQGAGRVFLDSWGKWFEYGNNGVPRPPTQALLIETTTGQVMMIARDYTAQGDMSQLLTLLNRMIDAARKSQAETVAVGSPSPATPRRPHPDDDDPI